MSKSIKTSFKAVAGMTLLMWGTLITSQVAAGTIIQCGAEVCTSDFGITFNGRAAGGGELIYSADTGQVVLNTDPDSVTGRVTSVNDSGIIWTMNNGSTLNVSSLFGNADPILGFGLGATTGNTGSTFGFTFNLPIALQGTIYAKSSVSYSLTSLSTAGAQIAPVGGNKIVTAYEVDTSVGGQNSLNKGVDVGDKFFFSSGPQTQNSAVFTANNSFTGNLGYDLMTVKVDFSLSADSAVGISGFVEQVVVPVPAAVWLFGSGLIGLIAVARRTAVRRNFSS